jgi:hypothetical protein
MAAKKPKIPWKIETVNELTTIDPGFATRADGANNLNMPTALLNHMNSDDLMDKAFQIDEMATIMFWKIMWIVRQRFDSDTLFGRYVEEYRNNSARTLCPSSSKEIYRAWIAGRFCETYGIDDISSIGLTKTAIYELGSPTYEDVAGLVLADIKERKTPVPVYEVKRLLRKAKSIDAVVETPTKITQSENIAYVGGDCAEINEFIDDFDENVIDEIITLVKAQQSVGFVKRLIKELQNMI